MAATILYSMMSNVKSNQVEPFVCVRDLLLQFSRGWPDELSGWLPDEWLKTHPDAADPDENCGQLQLGPEPRTFGDGHQCSNDSQVNPPPMRAGTGYSFEGRSIKDAQQYPSQAN